MFFTPTASERRGLIVLLIAMVLAIGVILYSFLRRSPEVSSDMTIKESKTTMRSPYYAVQERKVETFAFDPNEADSTTLLRLGFAPFQVRGIYRYRGKGGRYHELADVQRIPGMTNEQWERLASYVRIDRRYQYVTPGPRRSYTPENAAHREAVEAMLRDTVLRPMKLRAGETVDVNVADTNLLKRIPGIGSYYANRIVNYRERLGGFIDVSQALEADEGVPASSLEWMKIVGNHVRQLDVNHANKRELLRHPYLSSFQATAIWQYRHNYGQFRSLSDLLTLSVFAPADIERLRPYLLFK